MPDIQPYDPHAPLHGDRVEAFRRVERAVKAGAGTVVVEHGDDRRSMARFACILRAFELDGIAAAEPGPGPGRVTARVTFAGRRRAMQRDAGGLALFPSHSAVRVVERPVEWFTDVDLAAQAGRGHLRAVAPGSYDEDTRAGSAVTVLLDPLADWSNHPTYLARRHGEGDALRAWEVFTLDGECHGLLLMTADGFDGVEPDGSVSPERSPGAAAWEIVMNS
ncbi:hypothetical protein [Methylobacterium oryzae]|uniref:Uncharacterized protein n=1 Tax=Methylobacterium oryzae TaxID=334852 RepID=A0ABU7TRZ8_9HYPH